MDFYSYLDASKTQIGNEKIAEDGTYAPMKGNLEDTFPKRLHRVRSLVEYIPRDTAKKIIAEGVSLIKTIAGEENHRKIERYLLNVFLGLRSREEFIDYLMRIGKVSEERASFIADDQITKAAERFLVEKWKSRGCKRVRWIHYGDSDPRLYHIRKWNGRSGKRNGRPNGLNGFEFAIDKPPVIDQKTKERGWPGQLINCHCHIVPLWD